MWQREASPSLFNTAVAGAGQGRGLWVPCCGGQWGKERWGACRGKPGPTLGL